MMKNSALFVMLTACLMAASLSATAAAQDDSALKALEALDKALEAQKTSPPSSVSPAPTSQAPSSDAANTHAQPTLQAQDVEALKKTSETAWDAGDMDTACEKSRIFINTIPTAQDFCAGRGYVIESVERFEKEFASGNYAKAEKSLEQAKELCPKAKAVVDIERKLNSVQKQRSKSQDQGTKANARKQEGSDKTKRYDEFDRRQSLIRTGYEACKNKEFETCRKLLSEGIDGIEIDFYNEYPDFINNARNMLAAVEKELAKKSTPTKQKK
jgi:tetratricopeptide (TPR) repeat protein